MRPRSFGSRDQLASNFPLADSLSADLLARLTPWRATLNRPTFSRMNEKPDPPRRPLSDAAARALAEAEARRAAKKAERAREIGGRGGLDPARYGDWEVKGIASDF